MKVREGFVSNSSSTSFVIYGVCMDKSELLKGLKETNPKLLQNFIKEAEIEDEDDIDFYELLDELEFEHMSFYASYSGGEVFIGRNWSSIEDDETGKQFKDNVKDQLIKVFGDNLELNTFDECFYD